MRYRRWTPAALAIPALLLAACGSSTSPGSASSSMSTKSSMSSGMTGKSKSGSSGMMAASNATLMKVKTRIGPVLANSKGFTLYWYAKDTSMTSACTGGCATAWPPLIGTPKAAMGVRLTGKLAAIAGPAASRRPPTRATRCTPMRVTPRPARSRATAWAAYGTRSGSTRSTPYRPTR